jgi:hypothetical protein
VLSIQSIAPADDEATSRLHFMAATLALTGGFSSSVVQRIIQRMIETLEAIMKGGAEQNLQALEQLSKQRLEEELAKDRVRTQSMLVDMQRRLAAGESTEALREAIAKAIRAILSNQAPSPEPDAEAPERAAPPRLPAVQEPDAEHAAQTRKI